MNVFFNTYFLFVFNRIYLYIINMCVGRRLKELRKELKISQKELGGLLNVAQQVISYYEKSGNIDASKLAIVAKHYGVDIRYFFEKRPLKEYRVSYFDVQSLGGPAIPLGWDEMLDELSELNHDKVKIIEAVVKALIKEFSN
ncbi:MAG: hypothetical protein C0602_12850 [Denitrovibrio sp.]|nr:MAG: hypothetical protein C0602_12850 [Denitrovibrio sp.]